MAQCDAIDVRRSCSQCFELVERSDEVKDAYALQIPLQSIEILQTLSAVDFLTEILAEELKGHNVRAHCVLPGTMDTEANRRAMPGTDFSQWVATRDVARVIHFLLGDDARAVRSVAVPVLG